MTSTEIDAMDAGSLRAAYKVLMNEHQHLVACYESLIRQTTPVEPVPGDERWSKRVQLDDALGRTAELIELLRDLKRLDRGRYLSMPLEIRKRVQALLAKHGGDA